MLGRVTLAGNGWCNGCCVFSPNLAHKSMPAEKSAGFFQECTDHKQLPLHGLPVAQDIKKGYI